MCQLFTFQHLPIVPLYIFSEILILVNWKERVLRTYLTFQAFRTLLFLKKLKEEKYIYVCIWACVFHFPCSLFCCVVSIFHHLCFIVENVLYHFLYCAPFIKHWILLASIPINFFNLHHFSRIYLDTDIWISTLFPFFSWCFEVITFSWVWVTTVFEKCAIVCIRIFFLCHFSLKF